MSALRVRGGKTKGFGTVCPVIAVSVLVGGVLGCRDSRLLDETGCIGRGDPRGGNQWLSWGAKGERLVYAVFKTRPFEEENSPAVETEMDPRSRKKRAVLLAPDGSRIPLPCRYQLLEIVDGKLRWSEERVEFAEFVRYVREHRGPWGIDSLLEFVGRMRGGGGEEEE